LKSEILKNRQLFGVLELFYKLDLQIGNFGIIAQGSDFPEIALQNCKSDMTTSLSVLVNKATFF
jgi:hypothetical protein